MNIVTELTNSSIFFTYGIFCSFLYYVCLAIEKKLKPKILTYILDCIYVTACFIPFFYFYINILDGVLKLYEIVFFVLGFAVYKKYINNILIKMKVVKLPPFIAKIISKIKCIITK